ncbi:MAG: LytTR family DNA-binding domain-containing protein, partial [Rikenellaceae bacterium]
VWFSAKANSVAPSPTEPIDSIFVKSEYKLLRIELNKLLYVEGLKDYVKFRVEGEAKPILSLMNMKRAEEILPADQFLRVHRSFIVRKDKIKVIERSRILFDAEAIPIGESYKSALQEYLKVRII